MTPAVCRNCGHVHEKCCDYPLQFASDPSPTFMCGCAEKQETKA